MKIIGWFIVLIMLVLSISGTERTEIFSYFDAVVLAWMVGLILGGLLISFSPKEILSAIANSFSSSKETDASKLLMDFRVFNRGYHLSWSTGIIGYLLGFISTLKNMDDPTAIGSGTAQLLLCVLYGAFFAEFFFASLQHSLLSRADGIGYNDLPRFHYNMIGYASTILFMTILGLLINYLSLMELPEKQLLQ